MIVGFLQSSTKYTSASADRQPRSANRPRLAVSRCAAAVKPSTTDDRQPAAEFDHRLSVLCRRSGQERTESHPASSPAAKVGQQRRAGLDAFEETLDLDVLVRRVVGLIGNATAATPLILTATLRFAG
jgi:hypothetical protein